MTATTSSKQHQNLHCVQICLLPRALKAPTAAASLMPSSRSICIAFGGRASIMRRIRRPHRPSTRCQRLLGDEAELLPDEAELLSETLKRQHCRSTLSETQFTICTIVDTSCLATDKQEWPVFRELIGQRYRADPDHEHCLLTLGCCRH